MFFPTPNVQKIINMKHAYITFFKLSGAKVTGRLKKIEEWLILENENVLLLKLFKKDDFKIYKDYDHLNLITAFMSSLSHENKDLFIKILNSIAELYENDFLEPFSSYYEIGLSIEEEYLNNFYFKRNG